jgi:hypothetical protein
LKRILPFSLSRTGRGVSVAVAVGPFDKLRTEPGVTGGAGVDVTVGVGVIHQPGVGVTVGVWAAVGADV